MKGKISYRNANIFTGGRFVPGGFTIENGRFASVTTGDGGDEELRSNPGTESEVDLRGAYVIPGLVDIHIHGAAGVDFSSLDSDETDGLLRMAGFLVSRGVTSFVPTTMTMDADGYRKVAAVINSAIGTNPTGLHNIFNSYLQAVPGMRMEGPFLSSKYCGAQNPDFIVPANMEMFREINEISGGKLLIMDVAPETEGALEFISEASGKCVISLGHTNATYERAMAGFEAGARHVTHLYNAMSGLHHRNPGLVGAVWDVANKDMALGEPFRKDTDSMVSAEIICDGIHVHESAVRAAFRQMKGKICLVSDALCCMGITTNVGQPKDIYTLSGKSIICRDGAAWLADGTLAGAASDLYADMLKAVSFGIPKEDAIAAATSIPAQIIGNEEVGEIAVGKLANFVICDENLTRKQVYFLGEEFKHAGN